jgi:5-carboxymethyl-2-hydroxymuconic-semialdehyde dehydrogenase
MKIDVDPGHWIGGKRVGSAGTFTDLSPIDESPIAEIARGGPAEVDAAVHAARHAFPARAATPPAERAAILHAIADGIEKRVPELAQVETLDNGGLLRSQQRSVMPRTAHNFRFFADWLSQLDGGQLEIRGHREQVSWRPSGVTA